MSISLKLLAAVACLSFGSQSAALAESNTCTVIKSEAIKVVHNNDHPTLEKLGLVYRNYANSNSTGFISDAENGEKITITN